MKLKKYKTSRNACFFNILIFIAYILLGDIMKNLNENSQQTKVENEIYLVERKNINISGVLELFSSSESEVKMKTELGNLKINGVNLKISQLNLENKQISIEGEISTISYLGEKSKNLFQKVFK